MRRLDAPGTLSAAVLVVVLFSACAAAPPRDKPAASLDLASLAVAPHVNADELVNQRTTVHDAAGRIFRVESLPFQAPVAQQRYVGREITIEPVVAVSQEGAAFYPTARRYEPATTDQSMFVQRSRDGGQTWVDVTPPPIKPFRYYEADPILYRDPLTGRVFVSILNTPEVFPAPPLCSGVSWTDDEGETWTTYNTMCGGTGRDHQTVWSGPPTARQPSGYPSVLYYCWNDWGTAAVTTISGFAMGGRAEPVRIQGNPLCQVSTDSGQSWSAAADPNPPSGPCADYLVGHGRSSQATGVAYLPQGRCGQPTLLVSKNDGQSWTRSIVNGTVGSMTDNNAVAVDAGDNVHYAWVDREGILRLATSADHGRSWGPGFPIQHPAVTVVLASHVAIVAGEAGKFVVFYLGSTVAGGREASDTAAREATWTMYAAFVPNALNESLIVVTTAVNEPADPVARGPCWAGGCSSPEERPFSTSRYGMYDYLGADIDPSSGHVWVAYMDLCVEECADPSGTADAPPNGLAAVGVQTGGFTILSPSEGGP